MTNLELLNLVRKYKESMNPCFIDTLEKELESNVRYEKISLPSDKKRLRAAERFLKNNVQERFKSGAMQNGLQVFTNSYAAFFLVNPLDIPMQYNPNYPDLCRLLPKDSGKPFTVDYSNLKANYKLDKESYTLVNMGDYELCFNNKLMIDTIDILGTTDLEFECYGRLSPIKVYNPKTEDIAMVMPKNYRK